MRKMKYETHTRDNLKFMEKNKNMKKEQGFTLIELLIVVAIIAIIAAIAVPNLLSARMTANETGAIAGLRTLGSGAVAFSAVNNGNYGSIDDMVTGKFIDARFNGSDTNGFNGYYYVDNEPVPVSDDADATAFSDKVAGFTAKPLTPASTGRYDYGMGSDLVVRFVGAASGVTVLPKCGTADCAKGDPIGTQKK